MAFAWAKAVTIDPAQCGGGGTNYPVCIGLGYGPQSADPDLRTVANGGLVRSASGYDIRPFADVLLTVGLAFELTAYDPVTGSLSMWVNVPSVPSVFYLAFGDVTRTTDASSTATWPSQYQAVWHFDDGFGGKDSTVNANTLSVSTFATVVDAQIGKGINLNGTSAAYAGQRTACPVKTFPMTYSCWVKLATTTFANNTNPAIMIIQQQLANPNDQVKLQYIRQDVSGGTNIYWINQDSTGTNYKLWIRNLTYDLNWHHFVATWLTSTTATLVMDGVNVGFVQSGTGGTALTSHPAWDRMYVAYSPFPGVIDEARITNDAYPADTATMDYNSQKAGSTFLSWGTPFVPVNSDLKVRKQEPGIGSSMF